MATYTLKRKTFGLASLFKMGSSAAKGENALAGISKTKLIAGATGATAAAGLGIGAVKAGSTLKDVAAGDMGKENGEGY